MEPVTVFARKCFLAIVISIGGLAFHVPETRATPLSVALFGDFESEIGCPADFDPLCLQAQMVRDSIDGIWRRTLSLPAGNYDYYAAVNGSLGELYGRNATLGGPAIDLTIPSGPANVSFYFDDTSHWITDNRNSVIATVAGSFQSELGCSGDFVANCLRSWLEDPDGDGIYRFSTTIIPPGTYSAVVFYDESFSGGPQSAQLPFTVPANGATTCFSFSPATHALDISTNGCGSASAPLSEPSSPWLIGMAFLVLVACNRKAFQFASQPGA